MSLPPDRIAALAQGYLTYIQTRNINAAPPHQPSQREVRGLYIWAGLFSISPRLQGYLQHQLGQSRPYRSPTSRNRVRDSLEVFLHGQNGSLQQHLDPDLQRQALELTSESVYDSVATHLAESDFHTSLGLSNPIDSTDALAFSLAKWFKSSFMKWVDPIKCVACGGKTKIVRMDTGEARSEEEKVGGAGNVEVWGCVEGDNERGCGGLTRFPRYNRPQPLLTTRTGRCGEFASIFHLFLLSHSLPARYILNTEDHVWNEYYSSSQGRWIHLDSCEGSFDEPLLYEKGWGKMMGYCFAFGDGEVRDVTRRYVEDWEGCVGRRTRWSEGSVQATCDHLTQSKQANLDPSKLANFQTEAQAETQELLDLPGRLARLTARKAKLSGRTSGTKDWRQARHEAGTGSGVVDPSPTLFENEVVVFSLDRDHAKDIRFFGAAKPVSSSGISLTPCATSQVGSAAILLDLPDCDRLAIEMSFRIRKSQPDREGADGMALVVLQGDKSECIGTGGDGSGLGYNGIGTEGDFAVELDTYRSQDTCDDPPTPHISFHSPPRAHHRYSLACTMPDSIPDIADGTERSLRLELDLSQGEAIAWLSDGARDKVMALDLSLTSTIEPEWLFLWRARLPGSAVGRARERPWTIALTAATGGFAQAHDVTGLRICRHDGR